MSRQLVFSSTISVMIMATFALSTTVKAQDAVHRAAVAQVGPIAQLGPVGGR